VINILQGVGDFFIFYNSGGFKYRQHLVLSLKSKKHINVLVLADMGACTKHLYYLKVFA
jgi:hypothetical protein